MRFLTAGESHGKCLIGIIEGFPANVPIDIDIINYDLARRQQGYGRGGRMKIESDKINVLSGIRNGRTIASPIAFQIENKDYPNWEGKDIPPITAPRPGHADFAGSMKYNFHDVRNVWERSSARETAVRVAGGSIIKQLLTPFAIRGVSHVTAIGTASCPEHAPELESFAEIEQSYVRCLDKQTEQAMITQIKEAGAKGDSLGGIFEILIYGVPIGLGSHTQWDRKLDSRLAAALMSIQGIKGVEIGSGFSVAKLPGSKVHDELHYSDERGYYHVTNNAGGIEGGMSNGETIIIRCGMKPIPTIRNPLQTVDLKTHHPNSASVERSDTCAVPAASVIGELVALTVIAEEFLKVFGADTWEEMTERWSRYQSN